MAGTITNYNPNTLQQLRDWYERVAPKNQGQRTLFDISTGPVGALANLTTATEQDNKLAQILGLADILPAGKFLGLAAGAGLAGVTKGQRLFRGTTSTPDPAHPISRRFKNPGHEFGTHATVDPEVAGLFMEGGKQNRMHSLVSEVDKPLRLRDTGGAWSPDAVADEIRYNSKLYNERQKKMGEGFVPFEQLPTEMQDDLRSRGLDDMSALWHLKTGAPWLDRPDIGNKFSQEGIEKLTKMQDEYAILRGRYGANTEKQNALLDIYAKKMQKVIQEEGYDHISYKNVVEKNPRTGEASESVILFHPESVSLAPTEHIEYSDPFKDTTK